ncbi:hypothetical protein Tco_1011851 [Tanacetum coccineum]
MSPGNVAREGIPFELFRSTYPGRHVARERYPQRQVARDTPDLSLGNIANVVVIESAFFNQVLHTVLIPAPVKATTLCLVDLNRGPPSCLSKKPKVDSQRFPQCCQELIFDTLSAYTWQNPERRMFFNAVLVPDTQNL